MHGCQFHDGTFVLWMPDNGTCLLCQAQRRIRDLEAQNDELRAQLLEEARVAYVYLQRALEAESQLAAVAAVWSPADRLCEV